MVERIVGLIACVMCAIPFLLYKQYSIAFLITGAGFMVMPIVGIIRICLDCTLGIYVMYKKYKRILNMYS
mgnify:FL=1|jgi:hypothetical protein